MAWLQNWAERAEDLLNKIDQNAATVLHDGTSKEKSDTQLHHLHPEHLPQTPLDLRSSLKAIRSRSDSAISECTPPEESSLHVKTFEDIRDAGILFNAGNSKTKHHVFADNDHKRSPSRSIKEDVSDDGKDCLVSAEDVQLYIDRISNLETENQELNKQLLNLQHSYLQLRNENSSLQSEAKTSQSLVADLKHEMEMYRARAHKMLNEMKNITKKSEESEDNNNVYALQIKRLNDEIDFQMKKNEQLTESIKQKATELTNVQQQFNYMKNFWQQNSQTLESTLTTEKKFRAVAEEECRIKNQKLQATLQELSEAKNLVEGKQKEVVHLKKSIEVMNTYRSNDDLESRIQSLTQTLMLKQSSLETVTTERNALRLQLEKIEGEYKSKLAEAQRKSIQIVNVSDENNGNNNQVPRFMRLSPRDAGVTRRVKRAYSTLDAISNQTGAFIRRYPLARVCIFYYVVLLHIWVLLILFIDAPSSL